MQNNLPGAMIFEEIIQQGRAWSKLAPIVLDRSPILRRMFSDIDDVLFIGCGSALNVSYSGAVLFQNLTYLNSRAVPAAEIYNFPNSVINKDRKTMAVVTSRSGKTSEIVRALDFLKQRQIPTIGITCHERSILDDSCDQSFVLTPVSEQAVPTTRSVTGMVIAIQLMAAVIADNQWLVGGIRRLPELCERLMPEFQQQGRLIGNRPDLMRFAFVGNGPFFGLARESQLKVKEMTLKPSDAYPMFDFRHGPQSNVNEQMLLTVMISDSARIQEIQFIKDMKALGGIIWAICDHSDPEIDKHADYVLELKTGSDEWTRLALYLPAIQFMAYYHALTLGLDPDAPHHLAYWIDLSSK